MKLSDVCLSVCLSVHPIIWSLQRFCCCWPGGQKCKTNLDFTEARDSEWQWHQLGRMQVCNSLLTDNHASTSPLSFFTLSRYASVSVIFVVNVYSQELHAKQLAVEEEQTTPRLQQLQHDLDAAWSENRALVEEVEGLNWKVQELSEMEAELTQLQAAMFDVCTASLSSA